MGIELAPHRVILALGVACFAGALAGGCGGGDTSGSEYGGAGGQSGSDSPDASPDASAGGSTPSGGAGGLPSGGTGGAGGTVVDGGADASVGPVGQCGNSIVEGREQCDDGNQVDDDGCKNSCRWTCVNDGDCSDGVFCNGYEKCQADHTCAAGTPIADDLYCGQNSVCRGGACIRPDVVCGDGLIIAPENCEDGTLPGDTKGVDGDGCDTDCRFSCSNQLGGKSCDSGDECAGTATCNETTHTCTAGTPSADFTPCVSAGANAVCVGAVCTTQYCSNNVVDGGEQCDDGNLAPGDGCEPDCTWTCTGTDDSNCDPGDECRVSGGCDTTDSLHPVCNYPVNVADGTSCGGGASVCISGICRSPACGDGVVSGSEECDDQNLATGDGCKPDCTFECTQATVDTDCGPPPSCSAWTCVNNACVAVAANDGAVCAAGPDGGAPVCVSGACTAGSCGTDLVGTVDPGEECDRGVFNGPGTGCTTTCQFECESDTDCSGGDACSGRICQDVLANGDSGALLGKACGGQALADGTSCGAPSSGRICVGGGCRISYCGDGFVDAGLGEECDPPGPDCDQSCKALQTCDLSGTWAMKLDIAVDWPDVPNPTGNGTTAVAGGSGTIQATSIVVIQQNAGQLNFQISLTPCSLAVPDFMTGSDLTGFENETYGLTMPNAIFDGGKLAAATSNGIGNSPGSAFTVAPASVLIGLSMSSPFGAWPALDTNGMAGTAFTDPDADGKDGATALTKQGGVYKDVIALPDPNNPVRADQLYLVIRQIASLAGTIDSCDRVSGAADVSSIDNHVIGCHVAGGAECDPLFATVVDLARPRYKATGATFKLDLLKQQPGPPKTWTCQDVRSHPFQ